MQRVLIRVSVYLARARVLDIARSRNALSSILSRNDIPPFN
jgi:hypothetical protein